MLRKCMHNCKWNLYFRNLVLLALYRDKSLKGSVNVTGGAVVDLSEGEKPHMIEVRTVDGEVLSLSAPTAKDKARWLSCLTEYSAKENVQISTSESGDEVP